MANWQRTLNLLPEWEQAKEYEISTQELAAVVAQRLGALVPFTAEDIEEKRLDLAADFKALSEDEEADTPEFDSLMTDLYDWADIPLDSKWNGMKVCWVKTF